MSGLGFLSCPRSGPVAIEMERFRRDVEDRRCPLTGERTHPWSRWQSAGDGATVAAPTQQCPCEAQWALHGEFEVAWPSSPMVAFRYPDDDESPGGR